MKKLISALLSVALFLLANFEASAQNYQPFRIGLTYHYIAQDSIYSLRVDSVKVVAGDSVFVFNQIARKAVSPGGSFCIPFQHSAAYTIYRNNHFGHSMIKKPNGDYIFRTTGNHDFLLKTRIATGSSWTANVNPQITATLTSSGQELVGTIPDSVLTYTLSNGKTIKLSRNFGLIKSPNLAHYNLAFFAPRDFDFYALPGKGIGAPISSPFAIFNFQPGDKFTYYEAYRTAPTFWDVCSEEWTWLEVLSRRNGLNGDTVYYTFEEKKVTKAYGSPSAPINWCQLAAGTTVHPARTYQLAITNNFEPVTQVLSSGYYAPPASQYLDGMVNTGIFKKLIYNNREQMLFRNLPYDHCTKTFTNRLDRSTEVGFAVGLGETNRVTFYYGNTTTRELKCYSKGTETFGNCLTMAQVLSSVKPLEPTAIKAFPNPFTSEISLQFSHSFSAGKATILVNNVLGQEVLQREITVIPGQENRLELGQLPKGIYVIKAEQNGKVFNTRMVKE